MFISHNTMLDVHIAQCNARCSYVHSKHTVHSAECIQCSILDVQCSIFPIFNVQCQQKSCLKHKLQQHFFIVFSVVSYSIILWCLWNIILYHTVMLRLWDTSVSRLLCFEHSSSMLCSVWERATVGSAAEDWLARKKRLSCLHHGQDHPHLHHDHPPHHHLFHPHPHPHHLSLLTLVRYRRDRKS